MTRTVYEPSESIRIAFAQIRANNLVSAERLNCLKWPGRAVNDWWTSRNRREISLDYVQPVNEWIDEHPDGPLKLAVPVADWSATIIRGEYRVSNIRVVGTSADLGRI